MEHMEKNTKIPHVLTSIEIASKVNTIEKADKLIKR